VRTQVISLHDHRLSYRSAGDDGPTVLLLHGLASSSASWEQTLRRLGTDHRVIAPDMLGHGASEKPPGDYSLGAFASLVRDLLVALDIESATVVGHSLGGGVAMQFLYQYPQFVQRLVLVNSGGLGRDVSIALRAVSLPGAEYVLPLVFNPHSRGIGSAVHRAVGRMAPWLPVRISPAMAQVAYALSSLTDPETRSAFVHTARAVVDVGGQRISGTDRFYLAARTPLLLVWGAQDAVIPVAHAYSTHEAVAGSRLAVFERSGHFPQCDEPDRFAAVLREFIAGTVGSSDGEQAWREALLANSARL
jgi:pimeloyl-ACP methyl ester carboxylesterase